MSVQRVVATAKASERAGGHHLHVVAVRLEDGRSVSRESAIANIETGMEGYYTHEAGEAAAVVALLCQLCTRKYVRTSPDAMVTDVLLQLPDC